MTEPIRLGIVGAGRIVRCRARSQVPRDPRRRARRRRQPHAGVVPARGRRARHRACVSTTGRRSSPTRRSTPCSSEPGRTCTRRSPSPRSKPASTCSPRPGWPRPARTPGRCLRASRARPGPRRDGRSGLVLALGRRDDPAAPGGRRDRPGTPRPGDAGTSSGPDEPGEGWRWQRAVQRRERHGARHRVRGDGALAGPPRRR